MADQLRDRLTAAMHAAYCPAAGECPAPEDWTPEADIALTVFAAWLRERADDARNGLEGAEWHYDADVLTRLADELDSLKGGDHG